MGHIKLKSVINHQKKEDLILKEAIVTFQPIYGQNVSLEEDLISLEFFKITINFHSVQKEFLWQMKKAVEAAAKRS